jgi:hypothetical protein
MKVKKDDNIDKMWESILISLIGKLVVQLISFRGTI